MLVIRQKMIYREDLRNNPDILYVFGDNVLRQGNSGQAAEMRGEDNSFGVATKRSITHNYPDDYFFDNQPDTISSIDIEFERLEEELQKTIEHKNCGSAGIIFTKVWKAVVIPTDGLGTGFSRMPENAPNALKYIDKRIEQLKTL